MKIPKINLFRRKKQDVIEQANAVVQNYYNTGRYWMDALKMGFLKGR